MREESAVLLQKTPGWSIATDGLSIHRDFTFNDFAGALAFVNTVGAIAEAEGHHPDITLAWGAVGITLITHAIGGLSENDFILAAKINAVQQ